MEPESDEARQKRLAVARAAMIAAHNVAMETKPRAMALPSIGNERAVSDAQVGASSALVDGEVSPSKQPRVHGLELLRALPGDQQIDFSTYLALSSELEKLHSRQPLREDHSRSERSL